MTIGIDVKITLHLSEEFLSDIIINASETAYDWFAFELRKRIWRDNTNGTLLTNNQEFAPGRKSGESLCMSVPIRYDHPNDDEGTHKGRFTLDHAAVAEGIRRIVSGECKCGMRDDIAKAAMEQDAGQIDANLGDLIVQAAVFSEVVYG